MPRHTQPDLDGKRRVHAVVGLIILLIIVISLVIFIATNWRRDSQTDGRGLLGSEVIMARIVATA